MVIFDRKNSVRLIISFGFGAIANLLLLIGPIFMIQVYDRVVPSRSLETLIALLAMVLFALSIYGVMEFCRSQIAVRIGNNIFFNLGAALFRESIPYRASSELAQAPHPNYVSDLENVREFFCSNLVNAYMDLAWAPIFIGLLFLFHPWLGSGAIACCVLIGIVTILGHSMSSKSASQYQASRQSIAQFSQSVRSDAELICRQNMIGAMEARWSYAYIKSALAQTQFLNIQNSTSAASKMVRQLVQSVMLSIGAALVVFDQLSAGVMIAGTILTSRAIGPVEVVLSQTAKAMTAYRSMKRIVMLDPQLEVSNVYPIENSSIFFASSLDVYSPQLGRDIICSANFSVERGELVVVCGASGSGKRELVRLLIGAEKPKSGTLEFAGNDVDSYGISNFANYVGYVPERFHLFEGTIAENIARMSIRPKSELIVNAAIEVGIHEEILKLPAGYATKIEPQNMPKNLIAKIAFARAIFSTPDVILVHLEFEDLASDFKNWMRKFLKKQKSRNCAVVLIVNEPIGGIRPDKLLSIQSNRITMVDMNSDKGTLEYLGASNGFATG